MSEKELTALVILFIVGLLAFAGGFRIGYIIGNYNKEKI